MTQLPPKIQSDTFHYDTKTHPFKEVFEKGYGTDNLERLLQNEEKSSLLDKGYQILRSPAFQDVYEGFLKQIEPYLGAAFYTQSVPTLRIQKPGDKAVTFHVDEWSGHGKFIQNFWLPMVDLNPFNALSLIDEVNTTSLISRFQTEHLRLDEFESLCRKLASALPLKYGEVVRFGNTQLHGTVANTSDDVRLSFDFRVVGKDQSPGNKSTRSFYRPYGFTLPPLEPVISIVYCQNDVAHLSHVAQRTVIAEYCAQSDLDVYMENNELLLVPHYPVLTQHLERSNKPIVIFSARCLPKDKTIRQTLLAKMRHYDHEVHFALEGKMLSQLSEHYFDDLLTDN